MKDLILLCFKLGFTAFGGPAAHIAMLEVETVENRGWLDHEQFLELLAFTNIIPGPNSSEMVMAVGYTHSKYKGLFAAGIAFILPAILITSIITLFFSMTQFPLLDYFSTAMTPLLIVIIGSALLNLSRRELKNTKSKFLFIIALFLTFVGLDELTILLIIALTFVLTESINNKALLSLEPISLSLIFTVFLKIGATLYGSGYVLMSYLNTALVSNLNILSPSHITQAFAIGELTPGPVFTTATSLGIMMRGIPGGIVATVAIFIPSFTFMTILMPIHSKIQNIPIIKKLLNGVSIAALAIMASLVLKLTVSIFPNPLLVCVLLLNGILYFKSNMGVFPLMLLNLALVLFYYFTPFI